MELRYNLTQQDFERGLRLHERRLKGPLTVIRKAEQISFALVAWFSATVLVALPMLLSSGYWEEEYGALTVFLLRRSGSTDVLCWYRRLPLPILPNSKFDLKN